MTTDRRTPDTRCAMPHCSTAVYEDTEICWPHTLYVRAMAGLLPEPDGRITFAEFVPREDAAEATLEALALVQARIDGDDAATVSLVRGSRFAADTLLHVLSRVAAFMAVSPEHPEHRVEAHRQRVLADAADGAE